MHWEEIKLESRELNTLFIQAFPNLQEEYHSETQWQEGDDTGSHVVYGDVFAPYLKKVIEENDIKGTQYAVDFIEEVLSTGDTYANEVLALSVFEGNAPFFTDNKTVYNSLGEKTKALLHTLG